MRITHSYIQSAYGRFIDVFKRHFYGDPAYQPILCRNIFCIGDGLYYFHSTKHGNCVAFDSNLWEVIGEIYPEISQHEEIRVVKIDVYSEILNIEIGEVMVKRSFFRKKQEEKSNCRIWKAEYRKKPEPITIRIEYRPGPPDEDIY
jgi:hypothetical protein